jgi:hypothetical protein
MKSILKGAALLSAAVLIASCDSSSGGGSTAVTPAPAPQASVTGTAVKGVIDAASINVTDGEGNVVGTGTVTNGVYDVTYDADQAGGTLTPPLTISVGSDGATQICDLNVAGPDDCTAPDGTSVSFGQTYPLPAGFVLRTVETAITNGDANNASGATEIATIKAAEDGLTVASFTQAELAIGGLIETLTGIPLGTTLRAIAASNLAGNPASDSQAALAIAAFNAAVLDFQNDSGVSLAQAFAAIAAIITINDDGSISSTGAELEALANSIVAGLRTASEASGNGAVTNAIGTAETLEIFYGLNPGAVTILPQTDPTSTEDPGAVALTKAFIGTFAAVLGDVLETTGAAGFGSSESATEVFAKELRAVELATSSNATIAFNKLDEALLDAAEALDADPTSTTAGVNCAFGADDCAETEDDGLAFTLARTVDETSQAVTFTATDVSSAWPILATADNQVVITAAEATATGETSVSIPAVTVASDVGDELAQTFTGSYTSSITAAVAATDEAAATPETRDAALTGTIETTDTGTSSFAVSLAVSDVVLDDEGDVDSGDYTATFSFAASDGSPSVSLGFVGDIGDRTQAYSITTPSGTISGTVVRTPAEGSSGRNNDSDTVTITDGTATLTTTLSEGNFVSGALSVGTTSTGTVDSDGIVTYTDGTVQALPAIIF